MRARASIAIASLLLVLATSARATPPADPAERGEMLTRIEHVSATAPDGSALGIEVHLPAGPSFARPVVLVSHGWFDFESSFASLADHLASRGFAAAVIEEPKLEMDPAVWTGRARAALDALGAANARPHGALFGELDLARVGFVGHSYGGTTAIMTAAEDARVKAVVALAPGVAPHHRAKLLDAATSVRAPLLVVGAEQDQVVPPRFFARAAFDRATKSALRLYVEIRGADHTGFTEHPLAWLMPKWPFHRVAAEQQRAIARRYATAWLEEKLGVRSDARAFTDGSTAKADARAGTLSRICLRHGEANATRAPKPPSTPTIGAAGALGAIR